MGKFYLRIALLLFFGWSVKANAQFVGVGEPAPNSKMDVVHTGTTGNSLELTHSGAANASSAAWIKNGGTGAGINVDHTNAAATAPGVIIDNYTAQPGLYIISNAANISTVDDISAGGGIGNYIFFDGATGTGAYVDSIGGDGFGFLGTVRTASPTVGNLVYGSVFAGNQFGLGHGIILNHYGTAGRNAEFNVNNPVNADPGIFSVHLGQGPAITAQNQNNAITGTIAVADIAYTGTDVADHIGVEGSSLPAAGWGVGVHGMGNYYGVFSTGDFGASGTKTFLIDHPQDPANKFLRHFSVESNEVLNMYRGIVTLDGNGQATVNLPAYFEDVNKDFSYQLTAIGTPQQPYVLSEISGNQFVVAGTPNTKVSWLVIAQRNDIYVQENPDRITDEPIKQGEREGKYVNPEAYGQPKEAGLFYHPTYNTEPRGVSQPTQGRDGSIKKARERIEKLDKDEKK